MFNPLLEDFSQLKDQDLENRMAEINKKYNIALKTGNSGLVMQIVMVMDALREETSRRQAEATKKLMQKQNKDLDGLINVG